MSSFFRELLDSLDLDLDLSNLGVPEDALVIIQQFLENQTLEAVLGFLNNLFNAGDQFGTGYDEDIFMKTSVDKILYAVSLLLSKKYTYFIMLFKGERSKLLHAIGKVVDLLTGSALEAEKQICDLLPGQVSNCEFGIFKGKNATKEGSFYTVNNGRYEKFNFLMIEEYNGASHLPENWWVNVGPSPSANKSGETGICHDIYGNDGTQFPPFVNKEERLWLFVGELCRSIWLDFTEEIETNGIDAYRYRPPFSGMLPCPAQFY